jgi:general stress protein CsbA
MLRDCPECLNKIIHLNLFDLDKRTRCDKCRCEFEYISPLRWIESVLTTIVILATFSLLLYLNNWILALIIIVFSLTITSYLIMKYGALKLVGLKAELKKKGIKSKASTLK